jgi:predicted transcriptional regulator
MGRRKRVLTSQHYWTFFSNHAHVYFILALNPDIVLRQVAAKVGITERAVQRIVQDLEESGYIIITKTGRNNHYSIVENKTLRHSLERNVCMKDLVDLVRDAIEVSSKASS